MGEYTGDSEKEQEPIKRKLINGSHAGQPGLRATVQHALHTAPPRGQECGHLSTNSHPVWVEGWPWGHWTSQHFLPAPRAEPAHSSSQRGPTGRDTAQEAIGV